MNDEQSAPASPDIADRVFLAKVEAAHELAAEIAQRKKLERALTPHPYDVALADRLDALPGTLNPGGEPVVYMAVVESQRKQITAALRRAPGVAQTIAQEPVRSRRLLEAVFDAAYGLCMGYDWNNGTAAKHCGYRRKLLSAVHALKPVPDFEDKYRGSTVSSTHRGPE